MLQCNPNCHNIAQELGRSVQYICNIKDYLDETSILPKSTLEQISLDKINEENRLFDEEVLKLIKLRKNKTQIRKILHVHNYKVNEAYERLSTEIDLSQYLTEEEIIEQKRLQKIKDFVNDGTGAKCITQIVTATDIPYTTVIRLVEILIEEGCIKKESIVNKKEEEKEQIKKRNEEIYTMLDAEVPVQEIAEKYQLTLASIYAIKKRRTKKKNL